MPRAIICAGLLATSQAASILYVGSASTYCSRNSLLKMQLLPRSLRSSLPRNLGTVALFRYGYSKLTLLAKNDLDLASNYVDKKSKCAFFRGIGHSHIDNISR